MCPGRIPGAGAAAGDSPPPPRTIVDRFSDLVDEDGEDNGVLSTVWSRAVLKGFMGWVLVGGSWAVDVDDSP